MLDKQFKLTAQKIAGNVEARLCEAVDELMGTCPPLIEKMRGNASASPAATALLKSLAFHDLTPDLMPDEFREHLKAPIYRYYFKRQLHLATMRVRRELPNIIQYGIERHTAEEIPQTATSYIEAPQQATPLLSEAWREYVAVKTPNWSDRTAQQYESRMQEALDPAMLGDNPIGQLSRNDVIRYRDNLLRLPAKRTSDKRYREHPLSELLAMDIPTNERSSPKTVNERLIMVGTFLEWCQVHYDVRLDNLLKGIKLKESTEQKVARFTDDEFRTVFNPTTFIPACHHYPSRFWVTLLAACSGARQSEICQLDVGDIIEEAGIHAFVVTDDDTKRVKTAAAKRLVPVHPTLIEIGFLDYVATIRRMGLSKLFPDIPTTLARPGQKLSNWFTNYRRELDISDKDRLGRRKTFHSFRHYLNSALRSYQYDNGSRIDPNLIKSVIGHSANKSDMTEYYSDGASLKDKFDILSRIQLDLDTRVLKGGGARIVQRWQEADRPRDHGR